MSRRILSIVIVTLALLAQADAKPLRAPHHAPRPHLTKHPHAVAVDVHVPSSAFVKRQMRRHR